MNRRHLPWGPEKIKPEPDTSMGGSVGKGSRDLQKTRPGRFTTCSQWHPHWFPAHELWMAVCSFTARLLGLQRWGKVSLDTALSWCQQALLLCISRSIRAQTPTSRWTQTNICGFYSPLTQVNLTWPDQERSLKDLAGTWVTWIQFVTRTRAPLRSGVRHIPFFFCLVEGREGRNLCFSPHLWFCDALYFLSELLEARPISSAMFLQLLACRSPDLQLAPCNLNHKRCALLRTTGFAHLKYPLNK